ncbi:MAG: glycosyl transferase, partial [Bryobacteraceae bacterium]
EALIAHNRGGHPSYLLGQHSNTGFWYYYLVVLPIKTPIPFLILVALGAVGIWNKRKLEPMRALPLVFSLAIIAVAMFSRINIGIRHVLAVYLGFSVPAAFATIEFMRHSAGRRWGAWIAATCVLWFLACSALAHPDYLAYCNALAGDRPEAVLADSDLDWGQDMLRLSERLQELGATELTFNPFTIMRYDRHGFPPVKFGSAQRPSPGWNAVSITVWKVARLGLYETYPDVQLWPDIATPRERVGHSILLYYFPYPARGGAAPSPAAQTPPPGWK